MKQTLAAAFTWLGNLLLDAALRLELRDWPASDLPHIDMRDRPFGCPPDCEPIER